MRSLLSQHASFGESAVHPFRTVHTRLATVQEWKDEPSPPLIHTANPSSEIRSRNMYHLLERRQQGGDLHGAGAAAVQWKAIPCGHVALLHGVLEADVSLALLDKQVEPFHLGRCG